MGAVKREIEDLLFRLNMAFDMFFEFKEDDGIFIVYCTSYPHMGIALDRIDDTSYVFDFFKDYFDKRYKDAGL